MTREEFRGVVGTVLDDVVTAEPGRIDPGWEDTILRAADALITSTVAEVLRPIADAAS